MTDRLRDDCFALPQGVDWTPVDEALGLLREGMHCVTGVEEVALAEGAQPRPYLQSPWNEMSARVAPDRSLVAYQSNETGAREIWLRTFPDPTGKWRVSMGEGFDPDNFDPDAAHDRLAQRFHP